MEKPQSKKKKVDTSYEVNENDNDEYIWLATNEPEKAISINKGEPISVAKLYAKRENTIQTYKQRIGLLASTLLENPDLKVNHFVYICIWLTQSFLKLLFVFFKNLILHVSFFLYYFYAYIIGIDTA